MIDDPAMLPFPDDDRSIQERFEAFDREHPEVFRLFKQYAESAMRAGFTRYSASAIFERIRWFHHIERGDAEFALNNLWRSRYPRKLAAEDPRFVDFFEFRALKSA